MIFRIFGNGTYAKRAWAEDYPFGWRDESGRQKDHFVGSPLSYLFRLQASSLAPTASLSWRPVTTENKGESEQSDLVSPMLR